MDQYDSVFEELEKGKSILYLFLVLLFCFLRSLKPFIYELLTEDLLFYLLGFYKFSIYPKDT